VYPLANLLATEQIQFGDMLVVDWDERAQEISFHREGQGAVIPSPRRRPVRPVAVRTTAGVPSSNGIRLPKPELEPSLTT
jgi:hypothetical protein